MKIEERAVAEMLGVWAGAGTHKRWVQICEVGGHTIQLSIDGVGGCLNMHAARRLAQQLNRLARRAEARNAK